jgi:hypothetical protein
MSQKTSPRIKEPKIALALACKITKQQQQNHRRESPRQIAYFKYLLLIMKAQQLPNLSNTTVRVDWVCSVLPKVEWFNSPNQQPFSHFFTLHVLSSAHPDVF